MKNTLRFYLYVGWELLTGPKGLFALHSLRLKEARYEGENITTFVFSQAHKMKFQAGQYGIWFMPKFVWGKPIRFFTIAASPTEQTLQLSTRVSSTDFKQKLSKLSAGDRMYILGPVGKFVLGKQPPRAAVLVAGGIGVTPMRSIAKYVHDTKVPVELTLIHNANGFYLYRKEFEQYVPTSYFVTKEILSQTLREVASRLPDQTPFYVSGPPAFVASVEAELGRLGHKEIRQDGFLGY